MEYRYTVEVWDESGEDPAGGEDKWEEVLRTDDFDEAFIRFRKEAASGHARLLDW